MSEALPVPFDYTQLEISTQVIVSQAAANIRAHGKLATQSIIAIGAELTKVKEAIGHGNYLAWIDAEFGWSDRTARNYVRAYEAFKSEPDCPVDASGFQPGIPVLLPVPPPSTATPGYRTMPRPATHDSAREAAVANASDGQSGIGNGFRFGAD